MHLSMAKRIAVLALSVGALATDVGTNIEDQVMLQLGAPDPQLAQRSRGARGLGEAALRRLEKVANAPMKSLSDWMKAKQLLKSTRAAIRAVEETAVLSKGDAAKSAMEKTAPAKKAPGKKKDDPPENGPKMLTAGEPMKVQHEAEMKRDAAEAKKQIEKEQAKDGALEEEDDHTLEDAPKKLAAGEPMEVKNKAEMERDAAEADKIETAEQEKAKEMGSLEGAAAPGNLGAAALVAAVLSVFAAA